jgi:hypothetical protein
LNTLITYRTRALLAAALALAGCGFGESGIAPPADRIFFPAGIAVDPAGGWLYVVNSNSDLRFNAGTVVAVNLVEAAKDRARTDWPRCPNSVFVQPQDAAHRFCCKDFVDDRIVNCDERGYVQAEATVRIGSFGGGIAVQSYEKGGQSLRRLFVAVRAEPSLTFIDATPSAANIAMKCTPDGAGANPYCDDAWRIKTAEQPDGTELTFQEEPHPIILDPVLGVLFVGHLRGVDRGRLVPRGVSMIDICTPATTPPRLASVLEDAFPRSGIIGVTALAQERPGDPQATLLAVSEVTSDIAELVFVEPGQVPCGSPQRNLQLAAGRSFASAAFATRTADMRGIVVDEPNQRAFVLHGQLAIRSEFNPPSVVAIDRRPDSRGVPVNQPTGVVEVCNGPNRILARDAGRGMRLYVNCFENGQIYVIEPTLLNVEAIIEVGTGPAELIIPEEDPTLAYVAGFANNNVTIVDLKPGSVTEHRVIQRIGFARPTAVPQ